MQKIQTLRELLMLPRKCLVTGKVKIEHIGQPLRRGYAFVIPLDYPNKWLIDNDYIEVVNSQGIPVITNVFKEDYKPPEIKKKSARANEAQKS